MVSPESPSPGPLGTAEHNEHAARPGEAGGAAVAAQASQVGMSCPAPPTPGAAAAIPRQAILRAEPGSRPPAARGPVQ